LKQIILELIRKYYNMGLTVKDTLVMGRGDKQVVRMMISRTAVAWEIKNRSGDFDDSLTETFLEKERQRIADQLYKITARVLEWREKQISKSYSEIDNRTKLTDHGAIMDYCVGALFYLEVISPYDIMYIAPLEREGINYGYKREPEHKETRESVALKELDERQEEIEE